MCHPNGRTPSDVAYPQTASLLWQTTVKLSAALTQDPYFFKASSFERGFTLAVIPSLAADNNTQ